jgi:hypothetical protein
LQRRTINGSCVNGTGIFSDRKAHTEIRLFNKKRFFGWKIISVPMVYKCTFVLLLSISGRDNIIESNLGKQICPYSGNIINQN